MAEEDTTTWTVHQLRRRWKPTKDRLVEQDEHEEIRIRIHRACSWMQRGERLEDEGSTSIGDSSLIFRWIALNALYGRWDESRRAPMDDFETLESFLDQLLPLDRDGRVDGILDEHKPLAIAIFEDPYVARYFWKDPTDQRKRKARKRKFDARSWYVQGQEKRILSELLQRIYLVRCQLVHGAASHDSRLNRDAVRRCSTMLGHLLPGVLLVLIDHGYEEDWGALCYPPLQ